ncbi:MAG TPA: type II toxin-antitoxin system VapC family toxin [Methylomirabilota bacterium]
MSRYVLDANVLVKWFVPEDFSPQAARLLEGDHQLVVPDLIYPEASNALWQKVRRRQITAPEARVALEAVADAPLTVYPTRRLVSSALDLALRLDCTVYDGCYLALAVLSDCPLVTGDRRLVAHVPGPLRGHLRALSSLPN